MNEKRVLIISQVIPQWYVDLLTRALGESVQIDIITGSNVKGNVIHSPGYDAGSFKSRLISWYKHYQFMKRWTKENKKQSYNLIFAVSNPPNRLICSGSLFPDCSTKTPNSSRIISSKLNLFLEGFKI